MNKQTQKRNAAFKSATKSERAVMVAKDALKMLNAGKTQAAEGNWVNLWDNKDYLEGSEVQVCDASDRFKDCQVCALGALMLSEIRHTNNLKMSDVGGEIHYEAHGSRLNKAFSQSQQKLMELAFEGGHGFFSTWDCDGKTAYKIENFYKKYPDENKRLRAILKNIIKNKGKFVL